MTSVQHDRSDQRYDTPEQVVENLRRWREAMEVSHAMLMAGLRDKVGPDGDVQEAYRSWRRQRREQKLLAYQRAAERFRRWQHDHSREDEQADAS